jgi:hypothetical protein
MFKPRLFLRTASNVIATTCVANEYVQATIVRECGIFDNVASTHYTSTPEMSDVQNIAGCSKYYSQDFLWLRYCIFPLFLSIYLFPHARDSFIC